MFKEKFGNLKNSLIKSEKKGGKKSVENLILLSILLIIVIVAINYIWKDNEKAKTDDNSGHTPRNHKDVCYHKEVGQIF